MLLSDHGHTNTHVHISLVDILQGHRFKPYHFPRRFSRNFDSAVMESGNAMAQLYFRRESRWGNPWVRDEMHNHPKTGRLMRSLLSTEGIPFLIAFVYSMSIESLTIKVVLWFAGFLVMSVIHMKWVPLEPR